MMIKLKTKKGFGMLEVLIASVIVMMMLGALIIIARSAMNNTAKMQQRTQALSLASEGIEQVRRNRDTNYIDRKNTTRWNSVGRVTASDIDFGTRYSVGYHVASNKFFIDGSSTAHDFFWIDDTQFYRTIEFINVTDAASQVLRFPDDVRNAVGDCCHPNGYIAVSKVYWPYSDGAGLSTLNSVEIRELVTDTRFNY